MKALAGIGMVIGEHGRRRHVQTSPSIAFYNPMGQTVTVTSQHPVDDERFEAVRRWAPMND